MALASIANSPATQASTLGLQDFMKILLTQLTYQDPLKPLDNQEFMAQMAQFTTLEQSQRLNDKLQQLVENQAALQSVGLIGRTIDFTSNGTSRSGTVSSLSLQGSAPVLGVLLPDGTALGGVALADVLAVH
jgi:flagellar basal-body rod modification protein FlgD